MEILQDFPYLTEEDILACLSYAADREKARHHQQLIFWTWISKILTPRNSSTATSNYRRNVNTATFNQAGETMPPGLRSLFVLQQIAVHPQVDNFDFSSIQATEIKPLRLNLG